MPLIDITELLDDPDFATKFDVMRREVTVGNNGRTSAAEIPFLDLDGVIAPASSRTLRNNPDLAQQPGVIECWTTFLLQGLTDGTAVDRIAWKGNYYAVQSVADWSEWGAGWHHAVAVRIGPIPRGN